MLFRSFFGTASPGSYPVVVGAGGAAGITYPSPAGEFVTRGATGSNSIVANTYAVGGGAGAGTNFPASGAGIATSCPGAGGSAGGAANNPMD